VRGVAVACAVCEDAGESLVVNQSQVMGCQLLLRQGLSPSPALQSEGGCWGHHTTTLDQHAMRRPQPSCHACSLPSLLVRPHSTSLPTLPLIPLTHTHIITVTPARSHTHATQAPTLTSGLQLLPPSPPPPAPSVLTTRGLRQRAPNTLAQVASGPSMSSFSQALPPLSSLVTPLASPSSSLAALAPAAADRVRASSPSGASPMRSSSSAPVPRYLRGHSAAAGAYVGGGGSLGGLVVGSY
jgi:hypothetical protein